jgi:hypothetical protein
MCIRIWFTEANTHLIGEKTLLSEIKEKLASLFSNNIKEELYKNDKNYSKSVNYNKSKSFGLSTSFMLFKSDNTQTKMNDYFSPFGLGTEYINTYNNSDKQYKILEKGLSIINDTFSNEYSVYLLNLSTIDTNSFYNDLINNFNNSIKYYISEIFNEYLNDDNYGPKDIIDLVFNYFDNYFFKTRIFANLRKNIYEKVYLEVKNNLLEYIKNKYLDKNLFKNKKNSNLIKSNTTSSTKSNISTNLNSKSFLKSSFFNFNNDFNLGNSIINDNNEINNDEYKKEIVDYIKKNIGFNNKSINNEIEKRVEEINEQLNIFESFSSVEKWHEEHLNIINKNDKKILEELIEINGKNNNISIPIKFDQLKRYLLSYSLQYDWAFIKKVKNIDNYVNKNNINDNDEDIEMADNNELEIDYFSNLDYIGNINNNANNNEIGLNYFNNLDNNANVNNNNNVGALNLRSSFFDY